MTASVLCTNCAKEITGKPWHNTVKGKKRWFCCYPCSRDYWLRTLRAEFVEARG